MVPPSATLADAVRLTVVVAMVSVIAVVAAAGLIARFSKLPPVALEIVADTLPASTYTSSPGAGTLALPLLAPAAIVIVAPLLSVTVTAVCAGLFSDAVYVMLPPSATLAEAVRLTVVVAMVSVIAVVAAAGLIARLSKLPPVALLIVADTLPASTYTSSPGAGTLTVPELAPAAMLIVAPLLSVTVTAVCAALFSDAVYVMLPPSATLAVR